jgi:hypothetical protein
VRERRLYHRVTHLLAREKTPRPYIRMANVMSNSEFDEDFYLSRYGDVRQAVNAGSYRSGLEHYLACGKTEGRVASATKHASRSTPLSELGGLNYQEVLSRIHNIIRPKTYFEIGTLHGDTLKLSSCASVSVDPFYQISSNVINNKSVCHFFQMTSDEFFEKHDPRSLLDGPLELAFLDGMHLFEYLLRDFYNTERYCSNHSIIVLHDCVPLDSFMTVREPSDPRRQESSRPGYWTGDVWKLIPIFRQWRPDLKITVLDAPPTGLVLVTRLDPKSSVLQLNYNAIVDEYMTVELETFGIDRLRQEEPIVSTESLATADAFALLTKGDR